MAKIFISYSRKNRRFVNKLAKELRKIHKHDDVWFDKHIMGGDDWWATICSQIEECDFFIYVLSEESVNSAYCKAEWEEAKRLHKHVIPILRNGNGHPEINARQHITMKGGLLCKLSIDELNKAIINYRLPRRLPRPSSDSPIPKPVVKPKAHRIGHFVDSEGGWHFRTIILVALVLIIFILVLALIFLRNGKLSTIDVAQVATPTSNDDPTSTETFMRTSTLASILPEMTTYTMTATAEVLITNCTVERFAILTNQGDLNSNVYELGQPVLLEAAGSCEGGVRASRFSINGEPFGEDPQSGYQVETWNVIEGETEICFHITSGDWSLGAVECLIIRGDAPQSTVTPTSSNTPTNTPTPTQTSTPTRTNTATMTNTSTYSDWQEIQREISIDEVTLNVTSIYLPAGCYTDDTGRQICVEQDGLIDLRPVTNYSYNQCPNRVCSRSASPSMAVGEFADHPFTFAVTWNMADIYCRWRGAQLPTFVEWQYAQRNIQSFNAAIAEFTSVIGIIVNNSAASQPGFRCFEPNQQP